MPVGTYVAQDLGLSRDSRQRLYHNHLMEGISWRNNACMDLCYLRPKTVEGSPPKALSSHEGHLMEK